MIRYDCRHYLGAKPCRHRRLCEGCDHYDPTDLRVLVIKLGALGDVLRTTPLLASLRKAHLRARLTWLTAPNCVPLLQGLTEIDRLWVTDAHATARVLAEEWDLVINLDKDTPAIELAAVARAKVKRGFGLSPEGALVALNAFSGYALRLGLDDDLKFNQNTKTYQHIVHEMAELPFAAPGPDYLIRLTSEEIAWGEQWVATHVHDAPSQRILGVNSGAGRAFATKKWHPDRHADVTERLYREHGVIPLLLGSADEIEINDRIQRRLRSRNVPVLRPGESLSIRQFMSIVNQCDGFVTGDTLGMHIALGLGIPSAVIFTSTCAQEIELYGRGMALIGKAPCAPCYLSQCKQPTQLCADSVAVEDVYDALRVLLNLHLTLSDADGRRRSHA